MLAVAHGDQDASTVRFIRVAFLQRAIRTTKNEKIKRNGDRRGGGRNKGGPGLLFRYGDKASFGAE